jgi:hypothetical protein
VEAALAAVSEAAEVAASRFIFPPGRIVSTCESGHARERPLPPSGTTNDFKISTNSTTPNTQHQMIV